MKKCTKCGIEKPLTEFHKKSASKDGLDYWCRSCKSKSKKEYLKRADVKRRRREYNKKYYGLNQTTPSKNRAKGFEKIKSMALEIDPTLPTDKSYNFYARRVEPKEDRVFIYEIHCSENNLYYIGQTTVGKNRWKRHLYNLKTNQHPNTILQDTYDKFGEDSLSFAVIKSVEHKSLLMEEEVRIISKYLKEEKMLCNIHLSKENIADLIRLVVKLSENK
jgi:hypothetical protein